MKFGSKANKINSQENKNTVRGKEAGHQTLLKRLLGAAAVAAAVVSFGIGANANADEVKTETTPQTELVNKSNEAASAAQASEVAASTSANETNLGSVDASKVNANNTNNTNQNVDLGYSSTAETTQAAKETTVAETKETVANAQQAEADQKAAAEQAATKAAAEQEAAAQEAAKAAAVKATENTQPAAETHTQTPVETPQKAPETPAKEQEKPAPVETKTETNDSGKTNQSPYAGVYGDGSPAAVQNKTSESSVGSGFGLSEQNDKDTEKDPVKGYDTNNNGTQDHFTIDDDKGGSTVQDDLTDQGKAKPVNGGHVIHTNSTDVNGTGKDVSTTDVKEPKGGWVTPPTPPTPPTPKPPVNPPVNPPEKPRKPVNPQTPNAPVIPRVAKGNLPPTGENDALEAIMNATGASMLAALAVLEILRRRKQAGNKAK